MLQMDMNFCSILIFQHDLQHKLGNCKRCRVANVQLCKKRQKNWYGFLVPNNEIRNRHLLHLGNNWKKNKVLDFKGNSLIPSARDPYYVFFCQKQSCHISRKILLLSFLFLISSFSITLFIILMDVLSFVCFEIHHDSESMTSMMKSEANFKNDFE